MNSTSILKSILIMLSGRRWWTLLIWLVLMAPAQAAVDLKVAIQKQVKQLQVGSSTTAIIRDASGQPLGELAPMDSFSASPQGGGISLDRWNSGQLVIEPSGDGYVWIGDRWYRGQTRLVRDGVGITAVNQVDLEEYLYSVVGSEAIPSWPQEALKAQAVAARSYALYERSKSANQLYDLDSTTKSQVYKGLDGEYLSTLEAVNATKGEMLTYGGSVILAVFHSSSGGHTENVEDVWSSPLAYLRGVIDYDQQAPVFQWSKTFSASQLSNQVGGVGRIQALVPEKITPQGRVVTMKVIGDRGNKQMSGANLRQALDLRSTLFRVSEVNGQFEIHGRGFGHGIGLSQWGAYSLSTQGIPYQQILAHYYQQAQLARLE